MKKKLLSFMVMIIIHSMYAGDASDQKYQDALEQLQVIKTIGNIADFAVFMVIGLTAALYLNESSGAALSAALFYIYHLTTVSVAAKIAVLGWQYKIRPQDTAAARVRL